MVRIRKRRKPVAEINVVPYIDVMLVLLIIFMVTAPLMHLGVDIQLPQSNVKPMEQKKEPALISITKDGRMYLTLGAAQRDEIEADSLKEKLRAFLANNKDLAVLIGADTDVDYGRVYAAMALAQQAGANRVGLISQPFQSKKPK
jgi:biopolymer transport protein TolR